MELFRIFPINFIQKIFQGGFEQSQFLALHNKCTTPKAFSRDWNHPQNPDAIKIHTIGQNTEKWSYIFDRNKQNKGRISQYIQRIATIVASHQHHQHFPVLNASCLHSSEKYFYVSFTARSFKFSHGFCNVHIYSHWYICEVKRLFYYYYYYFNIKKSTLRDIILLFLKHNIMQLFVIMFHSYSLNENEWMNEWMKNKWKF